MENEEKTVTISANEYRLLRNKAAIFDIIRQQETLNVQFAQLQKIKVLKAQELKKIEEKKE